MDISLPFIEEEFALNFHNKIVSRIFHDNKISMTAKQDCETKAIEIFRFLQLTKQKMLLLFHEIFYY